jgi:flagellin-like protein
MRTRRKKGIVGIEAAIVLIAFVIVAASLFSNPYSGYILDCSTITLSRLTLARILAAQH